MKTYFDDIEIELTEPYIEAIKGLMREKMAMMQMQLTPDCWTWGRATIGDLSQSQCVEMEFGSDEEKPAEMADDQNVMVVIGKKKPEYRPLPNLPMCNALSL